MALIPWTRTLCVVLLFVGVCMCFLGALLIDLLHQSSLLTEVAISLLGQRLRDSYSLWRSPPGVPEDSAPTSLPSLRAVFPAFCLSQVLHPSSDAVGNSMGLGATWIWLQPPATLTV